YAPEFLHAPESRMAPRSRSEPTSNSAGECPKAALPKFSDHERSAWAENSRRLLDRGIGIDAETKYCHCNHYVESVCRERKCGNGRLAPSDLGRLGVCAGTGGTQHRWRNVEAHGER